MFYRQICTKVPIACSTKRLCAKITENGKSLHNESKDNQESNNEYTQEKLDEFSREFLKNRIELTTFQKILLTCGSSIAALLDPKRHDMIACLGETTGEQALVNILETMKTSAEGRLILRDRPRINTQTVNMKALNQLPSNTFGYAYVKFLDDNQVTPDSRMPVKFINDPDLAYIMTRYRECHDLVHTLLGMPTNMLGEIVVKWFEALNNGLPMCYGAALFGALRLKTKQRKEYLRDYLPWAIENGKNAKPLMSLYWEKRWHQDINELRRQLYINEFNNETVN